MNAGEVLEKIGQSLGSAATVRSVFGDPIQIEGKTVVPVAKVAYGFGAGGGHRPEKAEAGGGGGGLRAFPAGALEITPTETRFVPFSDFRLIAGAFAFGVVVGSLLLRRK